MNGKEPPFLLFTCPECDAWTVARTWDFILSFRHNEPEDRPHRGIRLRVIL